MAVLNFQPSGVVVKWCLMSSDVGWHIRDKLRPMLKHGSIIFTSTETRRLIRTNSPGRPPGLSHSSWTMTLRCKNVNCLCVPCPVTSVRCVHCSLDTLLLYTSSWSFPCAQIMWCQWQSVFHDLLTWCCSPFCFISSFSGSYQRACVRACMRACVVCFLVFFHTRDVKNFFQRMADVCFELYVNLLISLLDDQQVKINMCLCFVHQQVLAACLLTNFWQGKKKSPKE